MKRAYEEPSMLVELFATDNSFCDTCSRLEKGEKVTYPAQTINCIISLSDVIFTAGTSGCTMEVDTSKSGDTWYFVDYEGGTFGNTTYAAGLYFCWYVQGSEGGTPPSNDKRKALEDILGKQAGTAAGWHAGPATGNVVKLYTASY